MLVSVCHVLFDSSLSFGSHISSLVKYIARLQSSLNLSDSETLIHALSRSRLDLLQCFISWSAQKDTVYLLSSAHITPLHHDLHPWHHVSTLRFCF